MILLYRGIFEITKFPSKHWADNVGFELTDLTIADPGSGYTIAPEIKITGGGGTGAPSPSICHWNKWKTYILLRLPNWKWLSHLVQD